jgi:ribonuclease HI
MALCVVQLIATGSHDGNPFVFDEHLAEARAKMSGAVGVRVEVYTDSEYVIGGVTQWVQKWKLNGWKTATNTPVKNVDLWKALARRRSQIGTLPLAPNGFQVSWHHVKGHSGVFGNELADHLATTGRKEYEKSSLKNAHPHMSVLGLVPGAEVAYYAAGGGKLWV